MESLGHSITEEQSTKVFKHNNYVLITLMDKTRLTVVLETLDPAKTV